MIATWVLASVLSGWNGPGQYVALDNGWLLSTYNSGQVLVVSLHRPLVDQVGFRFHHGWADFAIGVPFAFSWQPYIQHAIWVSHWDEGWQAFVFDQKTSIWP